MEEQRAHLDHPAEAPLADPPRDLLAARVEGELRRAADEELRVAGELGEDRLVRGPVDAERLLAEQVLAGLQRRRVDLLVEVVRDGAVDGLDALVREQLAVVGDPPRGGIEALVPREHLGARVAHADDLRPDAEVGEVDPARGRARELAAHQAAADDADADDPLAHEERSSSASEADAPSWTIAIRAAVIAAGRSCWITLRP